jgi:hypothetical protein
MMKEGEAPPGKQRLISIVKSLFLYLISIPFLASDWRMSDTFERSDNGLSKGNAAPVIVTPAPVVTTPPAPKPAEPVVQKQPMGPTKCKDCVYRERCFPLLAAWIKISGKECTQSRRRRA